MAKKSGKVEVRKSSQPAPASESPSAMLANPFTALNALQHQVDRLFEDFSRGFGFRMTIPERIFDIEPLRGMERAFGAIGGLVPSVDIADSEKELVVTAELPGMSDKDIEVVVSDDLLTIKGEKKTEKEEKKKNYYMSERSYGKFERSFRLPDNVDPGKVSAGFENGILTIRAPKHAGAAKPKAKKIAIKSK